MTEKEHERREHERVSQSPWHVRFRFTLLEVNSTRSPEGISASIAVVFLVSVVGSRPSLIPEVKVFMNEVPYSRPPCS